MATKDIGPWVQDALDSLEFAMGPANSTWGKVRAAMGREEPWHIPFFAIGNEVVPVLLCVRFHLECSVLLRCAISARMWSARHLHCFPVGCKMPFAGQPQCLGRHAATLRPHPPGASG